MDVQPLKNNVTSFDPSESPYFKISEITNNNQFNQLYGCTGVFLKFPTTIGFPIGQ